MARVQTIVQLNTELVELVDREAARRGMSRSALIRTALEEFLRDEKAAAISAKIVEGYRRIPPATPDSWGALEEALDTAAVEVARRLDVEEAEHGHGPW
jgi:predicted transcriptional regulator